MFKSKTNLVSPEYRTHIVTEYEPVEPPECIGCHNQLTGEGCDLCRDNPELDLDWEIKRRATWMMEALQALVFSDCKRRTLRLPTSAPIFQVQAKEAMHHFSDDWDKLYDELGWHSLEQAADKHNVEAILEEGGQ